MRISMSLRRKRRRKKRRRRRRRRRSDSIANAGPGLFAIHSPESELRRATCHSHSLCDDVHKI
jgi:hypothetical protein